MESLKSRINSAKDEVKQLTLSYNEVLSKIKKEFTESNYVNTDDENTFRRAFCLLTGNYREQYSIWQTRYNINAAHEWQTKKYLNYSNIYIHDFNHAGFICKQEYLFNATEKFHKDIWWFYLKDQTKYTESLSTFVEDCKSGKLDLFKIFQDYNNENHDNYTLEIINEPSVKIKNVIIYLQNE